MSEDPADQIPPGTVLAGKLRIIRLIGEGGMGAVYEIEHEFTKHRRAMKMLHAEMTHVPGVVARFLREASAAGRIGNPHIIETYDAGELESGEPYLVMEMLSGRPLDALIEEKGQLRIEEALSILRQACDGIGAANAAGIVHRDLKPENLFLVGDGKPFVKILDFGISKFDPNQTGDHQLTQEGAALGTPFYMPPEQVRGVADLDARADVYALGVVLYECVTGRKPFYAESLPHIAVLIHEGKYAPITEFRSDAPPGLQEVIAKAMATNRDDRYESARALGAALAAIDLNARLGSAQTMVATEIDGTPRAVVGGRDVDAPHALADRGDPDVGRTDPSQEVSAHTDAAVSVDAPGASTGGSKTAVVVAALAVAAIAAGAWALTGNPGPAPDTGSEPAVNAVPAPSSPTAPPSVAPVLPRDMEPSVSAEPAAPVPATPTGPVPETQRSAPAKATVPVTPPPAPVEDEKPDTRATRHGLAEDNPF